MPKELFNHVTVELEHTPPMFQGLKSVIEKFRVLLRLETKEECNSKKKTEIEPELVADKLFHSLDILIDSLYNAKLSDFFTKVTYNFNGIRFSLSYTTPFNEEDRELIATNTKFGPDYFSITVFNPLPQNIDLSKVLFHEILESNYRYLGLPEAHTMAIKEEERLFGERTV